MVLSNSLRRQRYKKEYARKFGTNIVDYYLQYCSYSWRRYCILSASRTRYYHCPIFPTCISHQVCQSNATTFAPVLAALRHFHFFLLCAVTGFISFAEFTLSSVPALSVLTPEPTGPPFEAALVVSAGSSQFSPVPAYRETCTRKHCGLGAVVQELRQKQPSKVFLSTKNRRCDSAGKRLYRGKARKARATKLNAEDSMVSSSPTDRSEKQYCPSSV